MPLCNLCNKELKSDRALRSHLWKAHSEAGRSHNPRKNVKPWNFGLTAEDERIKKGAIKNSITVKKKIADGTFIVNKAGPEARLQASIRQSTHNSGGRAKWFTVGGLKVQGTWERDFATRMMEIGITVERCKPIKYILNSKEHHYTPDFYIPCKDLYIEIKGYWWGNDRQKMDAVILQHNDKRFLIIEDYDILMNFV